MYERRLTFNVLLLHMRSYGTGKATKCASRLVSFREHPVVIYQRRASRQHLRCCGPRLASSLFAAVSPRRLLCALAQARPRVMRDMRRQVSGPACDVLRARAEGAVASRRAGKTSEKRGKASRKKRPLTLFLF